MALFDSADCAQRVKNRLNRPATDSAFTRSAADDVLYEMLTEAQLRVNRLVAIYSPDALWTVPTALTTSDSGATYTFGVDTDSDAVLARGHFVVYESREHIPQYPLVPNVDYLIEGTRLRIPNGATRTFSDGGPWAQYVAPSNVITSSTQPTIPKEARVCMIEDAAARCAKRLSLDPSEYEAAFDSEWLEVLAMLRTQAAGKGGPVERKRGYLWRYKGR